MRRSLKIYLLLLLFLPIVRSAYSQNTYPKRIIVDHDTLALITIKQVSEVNVTYEELEGERKINESLKESIHACMLLSQAKENRMEELKQVIALSDSINKDSKAIIEIQTKKMVSQDRHIFLLKTERIILVITTIVFATLFYSAK